MFHVKQLVLMARENTIQFTMGLIEGRRTGHRSGHSPKTLNEWLHIYIT